jgi:N-acetylglucosamine-6-sulfatase
MTRLQKIGVTALLLGMAGGLLLILPACSWLTKPGNQDPNKPNVILIISDDQPTHTMDYMPIVQKELVGKGINFANAYVTTPLCCPSRSSILTGLYAQHTGVLTNRPPTGGAPAFKKNDATVGVWFHQAGYRTFLLGKYFNNIDLLPVDFIPPGWDDYQIFWNRDKSYANPSFFYGYNFNDNGKIISYGDKPENFSTDVLTQKTLDFINNAGDQPFFIWLGYHAPHYPYGAAVRHEKMFTTNADWKPFWPPNFLEEDRSDKPDWLRKWKAIPADYAFDSDQAILRSMMAVDDGVGKILDLLEKRQIRDNTIIIYLSDNGMAVGEHHLIGKDCPYEECIKVPFVVDYPRLIKSPRIENKFVLNIDIAPTVAELANLKIPVQVDGVSMVPLLKDTAASGRDYFFFEHYRDTEADDPSGLGTIIPSFWGIRTSHWKYVEYEDGEKELYDLVNDPYEMQNIITVPGNESITAALAEQLKTFRP